MLARLIAVAIFATLSIASAHAQNNIREPNPVLGLTHAEAIMPDMVKYHHDLIAEEDFYCKGLACRTAFENARIASIEVVHAALEQDIAEIHRNKQHMITAHMAWLAAKAKSDAALKATRAFVTTTGSK